MSTDLVHTGGGRRWFMSIGQAVRAGDNRKGKYDYSSCFQLDLHRLQLLININLIVITYF